MSNFLARLMPTGGDEDTTPYLSDGGEPSILERARTAVGLQRTRRDEVVETICPNLTFRQRLYGFGICLGIGYLISLGSVVFFHKLVAGNPIPFAVNYTLGNLISLGSTAFLIGPRRQLKRSAWDSAARRPPLAPHTCAEPCCIPPPALRSASDQP